MVLAAIDNIQYDHDVDLFLHLVAHYDNFSPHSQARDGGSPIYY